MNKTLKELKIKALELSSWNPRGESEMSAGDANMVKLVESIKESGVIQPIAVWDNGERLVVIAGHRRCTAAKIAGLKEIPAMVFSGITEAQARMITRIENEVRMGVSPLKDSELVRSMLDLGFSQKEIAAHFGVSEALVCRRAKLVALSPEMVDLAKEKNFTVDVLERFAFYPRETQADIAKKLEYRNGQLITWNDIKWVVAGVTNDLDKAPFDTSWCHACANRSGAEMDLFGENLPEGALGSCYDGACFAAKCKAHRIQSLVDRAGASLEDVVNVAADENLSRFISPYEFACLEEDWPALFRLKKTKKFNRLYVYVADGVSSWQSKDIFFFGVSPEKVLERFLEEERKEEEEAAAREEEDEERNKKIKELNAAISDAKDKICTAVESISTCFMADVGYTSAPHAMEALSKIFFAPKYHALGAEILTVFADVTFDGFEVDYLFRDKELFLFLETAVNSLDFESESERGEFKEKLAAVKTHLAECEKSKTALRAICDSK